jgi:hypothetical protein
MYLQKVIGKINLEENLFYVGILEVSDEKRRIRIRILKSSVHGSEDPNPYQNVTDPEHWSKQSFSAVEQDGHVLEAVTKLLIEI